MEEDMTSRLSVAMATMIVAILAILAMPRIGSARSIPQQIAALRAQIATLQGQVTALQTANATLQTQVNTLQANPALQLGPYVSVVTTSLNGLKGPHIIFTGANVHIRDGSGATDDNTTILLGGDGSGTLTGLGNLVIGYDENELSFTRTGSHNLIVGASHGFTSAGGLLAGFANQVNSSFSSVSGGDDNTASSFGSSVSGGDTNTASGAEAAIGGGVELTNSTNGTFCSRSLTA
jgi:hypothetical protein